MGTANPEYLGNVVELTTEKTEAAKTLNASTKAVNDSVAAKAEAERKAAEEAEAARQAELAAQQQYVEPDYGYNDYSGGSGYSDYEYSSGGGGGGYSGNPGGGSSSGGNSGYVAPNGWKPSDGITGEHPADNTCPAGTSWVQLGEGGRCM